MPQSRVKLTDAAVERAALPDGKTEAVFWDSDVTGFGLRLRGGAKTFILFYRPAGAGRSAAMKRVRIGTPSTIKTAEARKVALGLLGKVAGGGDPAKDRAEQKRRDKATVSDLLDAYEKDLKRRKYVAWTMVMSTLRRRLKKHFAKDIATLRGADFAAIIEGLHNDGKPGAAEEFRSRCRAFLSFCQVKAKVIEHNPLFGFRRQRATRADRLKKADHGRALSDEELVKVWRAADAATVFGRFVRFLILTGCRRGEGARVTRSMILKEGGTAVIDFPAAFVKQGRGHKVPVTDTLQGLLDRCTVDARSDLLFPSVRTGGEMSGWNKMRAGLVKDSGVTFTFHDLRRTFRTGLSRLGVSTEMSELAIGHARENLIEIYDRDDGSARMRAAFDLWSKHVASELAKAEAKDMTSGVFA
ncbi:MAG: integrase family protein [Mesorhizobium sp.]|nr:integrase family protein [Mesorhizobium sp.]MBL8577762.1 integrase family protein [Mesorhizobium sp.]